MICCPTIWKLYLIMEILNIKVALIIVEVFLKAFLKK